MKDPDRIGWSEIVVIAVTLLLFVVAFFVKGFTKDLLLEAAVFLVSVKLILSSYKNSASVKAILGELADVKRMLAAGVAGSSNPSKE
jgi:hypothetical protein